MKIAKKYENINWKLCELKLFKLQSEILKAFRNGNTKDSNLRATGLKKGILLPENRKTKVFNLDERRYSCLTHVR